MIPGKAVRQFKRGVDRQIGIDPCLGEGGLPAITRKSFLPTIHSAATPPRDLNRAGHPPITPTQSSLE